jgi:SAM-dependent methyltransferase
MLRANVTRCQAVRSGSRPARAVEVNLVTDGGSVFSGSVAELYERLLVPAMFQPYAVDLAERVSQRGPESVLETACGTGALTHELRERLAASVRLVATDLNEPMIDRARKRLGDADRIEWRQADSTALPFPSATFSAVACQFGMMFPPDKSAAVRETRRVLAPGGLFAFNVWDSLDNNPYAKLAHETFARFLPDDPPTFFADIPHGFHDPEFWRDLLLAAGFSEVQSEIVSRDIRSASAAELALGLVRGTPVSGMIAQRGGDLEAIAEATGRELAHLGGERPFRSTMRALVVTAAAPW